MKFFNSKFFKSPINSIKIELKRDLFIFLIMRIVIIKNVIHILLYNHIYNHMNFC